MLCRLVTGQLGENRPRSRYCFFVLGSCPKGLISHSGSKRPFRCPRSIPTPLSTSLHAKCPGSLKDVRTWHSGGPFSTIFAFSSHLGPKLRPKAALVNSTPISELSHGNRPEPQNAPVRNDSTRSMSAIISYTLTKLCISSSSSLLGAQSANFTRAAPRSFQSRSTRPFRSGKATFSADSFRLSFSLGRLFTGPMSAAFSIEIAFLVLAAEKLPSLT